MNAKVLRTMLWHNCFNYETVFFRFEVHVGTKVATLQKNMGGNAQ